LVGAFVGPSIEEILNQGVRGDIWKLFLRYPVPLHDNKTKETWAVVLPNHIHGNLKMNKLTDWIPLRIKQAGSDEAISKWQNTQKFLEHIINLLKK
jgi:hypothetical protein